MIGTKAFKSCFILDARKSLFTVQVFASGMVAIVANSPTFAMREINGQVLFCADAIEESSIDLSIRLNTLEIMDEVNREVRREIERVMFDEVLESKFYPTAEFRSSRVKATQLAPNMYSLAVDGALTLHGITRGFGFESQLWVGLDTLRIQGSFSLLQSAFALKIASVAHGTFKLKDQLKFVFFLVARRNLLVQAAEDRKLAIGHTTTQPGVNEMTRIIASEKPYKL